MPVPGGDARLQHAPVCHRLHARHVVRVDLVYRFLWHWHADALSHEHAAYVWRQGLWVDPCRERLQQPRMRGGLHYRQLGQLGPLQQVVWHRLVCAYAPAHAAELGRLGLSAR
jgi:hypothetical protein